MKRLKYIFKKLKTLDYKNMIYVAGKVSKKTGKIRFFILLDMIHCALVYGSGYMDYFEFEFYLLNKSERSTYITSNINNNIINKYNDPKYNYIFDDKAVFNDTFKSFLKRDYINLKHLMYEDFVKFVKNKKKIVGFEIPKYKEVIDFVKELGVVVPKVRYVGWDIAITNNGPVVVEGNNFSGIF